MEIEVNYPALYHRQMRLLGCDIGRLQFAAGNCVADAEVLVRRRTQGLLITPRNRTGVGQPFLVLDRMTHAKDLPDHVLMSPDGLPTTPEAAAKARWLRPQVEPEPGTVGEWENECDAIRQSWKNAFTFQAEIRQGDNVITSGLRPPQLGALHAILAHWTVTQEPATIVMPTGTGKTETMLGLLVAQQLGRVLVLVPTNTLREQISEKFLSLGILRAAGVVSDDTLLPIVGRLRQRPKSKQEVEEIFRRCNVVVTTASVLGQCSDEVNRTVAALCTHLIVDEAHHVTAATWDRVRSFFKERPVLQFTATPYRGDGKLVGGKVLYNYPLRKAQAERYFKPIRFRAITEYNSDASDERIAAEAVGQLDQDIKTGLDHLLMARCSNIERAKELHALYLRIAAAHRPVLAHSELSASANREVVRQLRSRESRIVVCVDMFGEGFDLPELKIAALHDVHKSLAVTLQFTGRFTRTNPRVGDATVVANIATAEVEEALQELYAEDPDWNKLLQELSEEATGAQVVRSEFVRGFTELPENIPIQSVFPKMSTVVYSTTCKTWRPERAASVFRNLFDQPALNPKERVVMLITKEFTPVDWGDIRSISDTTHHLYLLHWDERTKLLYINSSNNDSLHEGLAKAVCGDDVALIRGEQVFRALSGVKQLILTNLGLGHSLSRAVRFTMHVGADIKEGLTQAQRAQQVQDEYLWPRVRERQQVECRLFAQGPRMVLSHRRRHP